MGLGAYACEHVCVGAGPGGRHLIIVRALRGRAITAAAARSLTSSTDRATEGGTGRAHCQEEPADNAEANNRVGRWGARLRSARTSLSGKGTPRVSLASERPLPSAPCGRRCSFSQHAPRRTPACALQDVVHGHPKQPPGQPRGGCVHFCLSLSLLGVLLVCLAHPPARGLAGPIAKPLTHSLTPTSLPRTHRAGEDGRTGPSCGGGGSGSGSGSGQRI